ncbi:MAG TPA: choice-of-anchor D domain-containing protein, partial [Candidatus Kapabacteria bacterium]|nr:choice-of-anchor D domain-containing protein [Candidatus Kapabacteria bacterium]
LENATLSVRGKNGSDGSHGGPGGGGGGGGALRSGGDGFSGGGGVGPAPRKGGAGTGSDVGTRNHHGGFTLNGVEGGIGTEHNNSGEGNDEGGGGGTGHPFGSSGFRGIYGSASQSGGFGGASGGGQGTAFPTYVTYAGGGGGYATQGTQGEGLGNNGGRVVGNAALAPLAGGSGGASGNIWYTGGGTGHGGGGGGAAEVTSFKSVEVINALVDAQGGRGSDAASAGFPQNGSGGGGGSGGAVNLIARDSIHIRTAQATPILDVRGGGGGTGYNDGGSGGLGRVRLDGRVSAFTGFNNTAQYYELGKDYVGLVISSVDTAGSNVTIKGYSHGFAGGPGKAIRLYYRFATTNWQTIDVGSAQEIGSYTRSWNTSIPRTADIFDTTVYLIAMQDNFTAVTTPQTAQPDWIMSHASGMIVDLPGIPRIAVIEDTIDFGKLRVGLCKDSTILVQSTGSAQLEVGPSLLEGDINHFVLRTIDSLHLAPRTEGNIGVAFCPQDTGCFEAVVRIRSNDGERLVRVIGCGIAPEIFTLNAIDFGRVRFGTCKDTSFMVYSTGNDTLTITSQFLTDPAFTAIAPVLPMKLAPKDSVLFTLRYCPASTAGETAWDTIRSDARTVPNWPIQLNGRGIRGELAEIPTLEFGEVLVGACKDSFIVLTNIGEDTVFVNDPPVLGGGFTVLPGQMPLAIAPGGSDSLYIRFCPINELVHIDADSVRPLPPADARFVRVRGKGVKGLLSVPNAIDHPCVVVGETIVNTLIIENTGTARVVNITTSASPAELTVIRQLGATLEVGALDSIIVSFTATTVGDFRGEIKVTADGQPDLQIPYTAHVTPAPTLEYSTRLLDYGTVEENNSRILCVTVMNPSCKPITITGTSLAVNEPVFSIQGVNLPVTLSDSSTFEFCVTGTSQLPGIFIDTLVFTTDAGRFAHVELNARVDPVLVVLEPDVLDFGTNRLNQPPPSQQARLINTGNQSTRIQAPVITGPDAGLFTFTGGVGTLPAGDTAFYDVSYLASALGSHTAYFVAYTGEKLDTVILLGVTEPNTDTIFAVVKGDTVFGRPGEVVLVPVRTTTDLTEGYATEASFRVHFDPMRLDLRSVKMDSSNFNTMELAKNSLGDWTITLRDPDTVEGSGIMAQLELEILGGEGSQAPIRIDEAMFPNSLVQAAEVNQGLVIVQECDTTASIRIGSISEVRAPRPNPARTSVMIPLTLHRDASVSVMIYNMLGQVVSELSAQDLKTGDHEMRIDVGDLNTGNYIYDVRVTDREALETHRGNLGIE